MENRNWLQALVYTDRMAHGLISNNEAYCGAVEKLLGIVPTERAQYIRVILAELSRIQSHLLGTAEFLTLIASAIYSPFMYMIIDREDVVSLRERDRPA